MAWRISRDKQFNSAKKNNQIMHSLTFKIVYLFESLIHTNKAPSALLKSFWNMYLNIYDPKNQ